MGIEILQRGERPEDRRYAATCHNCKSQLAWLKSDAKRVWQGDQREGPFTQIDCPVCGNLVTGY